jgi:dTDP-4-dehydrorhamnose reductase
METKVTRMKLFCFGFGYTANALADALAQSDIEIVGTRRSPGGMTDDGIAIVPFRGDAPDPKLATSLAGVTHMLISVPPDIEGDPVLRHHAEDIANLPDLAWIGYLSTIGVYGDTQGAVVDETSPSRPASERSLRRHYAEQSWQRFGKEYGKRVEIFRLPGIYGPGRSVIDNLRTGTAKRIVKPGQVFNRIHVADLATVLAKAMQSKPHFDVYNVADDEPAPPEEVVAYAAELLGLPPPPIVAFAEAKLTPMAASFYAECKRVDNARMKAALGVHLAYPSYREGLLSIVTNG